MASSLRADGSIPIADPEVEPGADAKANFESVFDNAGRQLFEVLESHTKLLVEDPDISVRRAFLASVPELCLFFDDHSNDVLLTHLNTYLNDRDWTLKCAFFDTIVGIATFIGSTSLEEFMLPLMIQALTDPEEYVVQAALHSLAQLAGLGLLSRPKVWELVELISRFTMHPNIWIRESAAEFLSMSARFLTPADIRCNLMPLVKPFLKVEVLSDFSELNILDALKRPLARNVFDQAITWALKTERGVYWKPLQQLKPLLFGSKGSSNRTSRDLTQSSMGRVARNDEDEQWLAKLRNLGLKHEDELKLDALREFIWRLSKMKARDASTADSTASNGVVSLKTLGVTPQTVFFNDAPLRDPKAVVDLEPPAEPYTIADALLDASMTIDDAAGGKKRINTNRRVQSVGPRSSRRLLSPTSAGRTHSRAASSGYTGQIGDDGASQGEPSSSRSAVRHQASALSLLDRKDKNKSIAQTGTTDTNAFGEVEGPFAQSPADQLPSSGGNEGDTTRPRVSKHSYEGGDPNIQKMLDNMYVDNFPRDVIEFGPIVTPIKRSKASRASFQPGEEPWKPDGQLVATFAEHKNPINRVLPSPDHVFFITGGDDGTVRVWDTARLERNITHRSRQVHKHGDNTRVVALCFVENSHCFVSCASDGSVHVVKVDTVSASGVIRYGKLRVLREYQLPDGEFAVWCEHFRQESNSVLIIATNRSRILGIDLRTMNLLYVLENPVHHGTPTCFCVDRKRNWLCVGTSHGVVDLWDLRFKMRLKGWGLPGKGSIYRLCIHPTKGRGKWICISGGTGQGEVTVWDLEKTLCREIYRAGGGKDGLKGYEAWDVDEDRRDGMLGRYATNIEPSDTANGDRGVRAMVVGTATAEDSRDVRHAFIVTGGSDKRLRFWDLSRMESSFIYSGLSPESPKPTYTTSHPTTALTLNTERFPRQAPTAPNAGAGSKAKSSSARPPRSTVISLQQQQLLQSHMDSILDVALLEYPYTMSVSVDRMGVVFVFQ
jgi:phosphoinositide-3-kinase regulatory subunit 4